MQHALISHDSEAASQVDLAEQARVQAVWDIWQGRTRRFKEEVTVLSALIADVQAAERAPEASGDR